MNKNNTLAWFGLLISFMVAVLVSCGVAFAANTGSTLGGGGWKGCGKSGWTMDTCYGATWRYYEWGVDTGNGGIIYRDDGTATIKGKSEYAQATEIKKCENEPGIWRYAMVAYNSGRYSDGSSYSAGDQVGTIGITGNSSSTYNSLWLGGGMRYIGDKDRWNDVKNFYNKLRDQYNPDHEGYSHIFWQQWGDNYADNLSWFCGHELGKTDYYAQSNASIRKDGTDDEGVKWDSTGITSIGGDVTVKDSGYLVGDTVEIVFSHRIFSNEKTNNVSWSVTGKKYGYLWGSGSFDSTPAFYSGNDPTVIGSASGVNLDDLRGGYYTAGDAYDSSGGRYVKRNVFKVTFRKAGSWSYCETLKFTNDNGNIETTSCVEIEVGEGDGYLAKSNVAIRKGSDSGTGPMKSTEIVEKGNENVSTDDNGDNVRVGDTRYIVFSHNAYSKSEKSGIEWKVSRPDTGLSGSDYKVETASVCATNYNGGIGSANTSNGGVFTGKVNFSSDGNGHFIGGPRSCGGGEFVSRDWYKIKFNKKGTYNFCETMFVNGEARTTVCATVKVDGGGSTGCTGSGCDTGGDICKGTSTIGYTSGVRGKINQALSDLNNKKTAVVSMVRKKSPSDVVTVWSDEVFAKPGDTVEWAHCYYPGVQKMSSDIATLVHGAHDKSLGAGGTTANTNVALSNSGFGNWNNFFSVTSSQSGVVRSTDYAFRNPTPSSISYVVGKSDFVGKITDSYVIPPNTSSSGANNLKSGKALIETNKSSIPISASTTNNGYCSWPCDYGPSASKCGTHKCNCVTTTSSDGSSSTSCETCPNSCYRSTCKHSNSYITQSRNTTAATSLAKVNVPYNFTNTAAISLASGDIYAGETATVSSVKVWVNTRNNSTLKGTYATQVDSSQVKVFGYVSDADNGIASSSYWRNNGNKDNGKVSSAGSNICNDVGLKIYGNKNSTEDCGELDSDSRILNKNGITTGSEDSVTDLQHTGYNVYDTSAGNYFCVVVAVYPYTVKNDLVMDSSGYKDWYISRPSCKIIAKKPTFQILGGGLYSAGAVKTNAGQKNHLRGVYGYQSLSNSHVTAFNSWVEQGVVAVGSVKGLASGAATGLNLSVSGSKYNGSYEAGSPDYCKNRVTLSFANYPCTGTTGNIMGGSGGLTGSKNVDNPGAVAEYWLNKVTNPTQKSYSGAIGISDEGNYSVAGSVADIGVSTLLRYTYASGNLTLKAATIPNQITHIVKATGNITITDNIGYDKSQEIALLNYIPKLVIYAQGDLNIQCNVTKIDAILIANGKINTCSNISNVDSEDRSVQLTINGAVVAKQVDFNRTYGAATGVNSGVPAEIVNYDVSSILWGRYTAGSSQSNDLTMTYQHELAPRL